MFTNKTMENIMFTREDLFRMAQSHDWYYMHSDDSRYYNAGFASFNKMSDCIKSLKFPFSMSDLKSFINGWKESEFEMLEEGKWWRKGSNTRLIAPISSSNIITDNKFNDIKRWFQGED